MTIHRRPPHRAGLRPRPCPPIPINLSRLNPNLNPHPKKGDN